MHVCQPDAGSDGVRSVAPNVTLTSGTSAETQSSSSTFPLVPPPSLPPTSAMAQLNVQTTTTATGEKGRGRGRGAPSTKSGSVQPSAPGDAGCALCAFVDFFHIQCVGWSLLLGIVSWRRHRAEGQQAVRSLWRRTFSRTTSSSSVSTKACLGERSSHSGGNSRFHVNRYGHTYHWYERMTTLFCQRICERVTFRSSATLRTNASVRLE